MFVLSADKRAPFEKGHKLLWILCSVFNFMFFPPLRMGKRFDGEEGVDDVSVFRMSLFETMEGSSIQIG